MIKANYKINYFHLITFLLVLSPILDPYIFIAFKGIDIHVMEVLMVFVLFKYLVLGKEILFLERKLFVLLTILLSLTLISFMKYGGSRNILLSMKVISAWALYAFFATYLWKHIIYEKLIKYATMVVYVATLLIIIQFIAVSFGATNFFDGKIPFLNLSEYDSWTSIIDIHTGATRVHSVFQEPSYFGIYCMPVFAHLLYKKKYGKSVLIFTGFLLSSSLVAILGAILVLFYFNMNNIKHIYLKNVLSVIGGVFIVSCVILILYKYNQSFYQVVEYSIKRISRIGIDLTSDRMGSVKIRILGYLSYFFNYPVFFKFVGVGAAQYPLFLSHYGVLPYSSTFVTIILNYGIFGLVFFVIWLAGLLLKNKGEKRLFVLIFIMFCLVDSIWFNWYFIYLLSWFIPPNNAYHERGDSCR